MATAPDIVSWNRRRFRGNPLLTRTQNGKTMTSTQQPTSGINYRPGVPGKYLYRVSERYLIDHIAPLISARRPQTAKLDLVLRGIALSPKDARKRTPGTVLRTRSPLDYAAMHDLVRAPRHFATEAPEDTYEDSEQRAKKREWVREQLVILEKRNLLSRTPLGDGRWMITMLSDTGNGAPFDDPGAIENRRSYISVLGSVVSDPRYRYWGSQELAAYACAMIAERYAGHASNKGQEKTTEVGTGTWYRTPKWFNGKDPYRPPEHLTIPFSSETIERGLKKLKEQEFISGQRRRSFRGRRFQHPRMIYTNKFNSQGAEIDDLESFIETVS